MRGEMKDRAKFVLQYANYTLKTPIKRLNIFYLNLGNNRKKYIEKCRGHFISVSLETRMALSPAPMGLKPCIYFLVSCYHFNSKQF